MSYDISYQKYLKCIWTDETECGFLHDIYEERIREMLSDEYNIHCPKLVSMLISKLANSDTDLQHIVQYKLTYKYFYNKFYGPKSSNYQQLRQAQVVDNAFIVTNYIITSVQYILGNNGLLLSSSYIVPSIHLLYKKIYVRPKCVPILKDYVENEFEINILTYIFSQGKNITEDKLIKLILFYRYFYFNT